MQISKDILTISRFLRQQRDGYMAPLGLRSIHAWLLLEISREPGLSQEQCSQRLGFDKSIIARHVALLEENGYLIRESHCRDKRVLQLFLTPKAQQLLPQLQAAMEGWEQQLLGALTAEQQDQLSRILMILKSRTEEVEADG